MIGRLIDGILGLSGTAAYAVVGVLAFAEAAAFVGLIVPGEAAVLLGGVLAAEGRVALWPMLGVAAAAAILGDSAGYEIGRRYGERLLRLRPLRRHGASIAHGRAYLQQRGGAAVFLGRWTSVLRALIPGLAGMSDMPYGRFLVYNVAGGVAWATTFTLLGYAAGASYRQVERAAGRASLVALGLLVVGLGLRWAAHWTIAHQERLRALGERVLDTPVGRWVTGRYPTQLRWLAERFDPRVSRGLALTGVVAGLVALGWIAGAITQDVYGHDELALLDPVVARWFATHRSVAGDAVAHSVLLTMRAPRVLLVLASVAAAIAVWRGWPDARRALFAGLGAWAISATLQALLPVPATGTAFPSTETTIAAAVGVAVGGIVGRARGWGAGARAIAAAAMAMTVVAVAALALGSGALSDVLAGAALGALWAMVVLLRRPRDQTASAGPDDVATARRAGDR